MGLAAQGFASARSPYTAAATIKEVAVRLRALQVDSVNVLVRAHYLPLFSRLGPYPVAALDELTNERHQLIELVAHQASFVPNDLEPLLRSVRGGSDRVGRSLWREVVDAAYVDVIEQVVAERGPIALSDLQDPRRRPKREPGELPFRRRDGKPYAASSVLWERSSEGKTVLDGLVREGRLALAGRRGGERLYDLAERVIPKAVRERPTPPPEDAHRELVRFAAEALGVATAADLANYFQLKQQDVRKAVYQLVAAGSLREVAVEEWTQPAYLAAGATLPQSIEARALIGPFDSLTWSRDRTHRLFGYQFSFEMYVPETKRRYGYYVLPFLLGDELVGRVDLKADRRRRALVVAGAYAEPGVGGREVVSALRSELDDVAAWLGLEQVEIGGRGDLARSLRVAQGAVPTSTTS